jgi:hypothetical protein
VRLSAIDRRQGFTGFLLLSALLEAGYLESRRQTPPAGRPQTVFWLTPEGRRAFADYVRRLNSLLAPPVNGDGALPLPPVPAHPGSPGGGR